MQSSRVELEADDGEDEDGEHDEEADLHQRGQRLQYGLQHDLETWHKVVTTQLQCSALAPTRHAGHQLERPQHADGAESAQVHLALVRGHQGDQPGVGGVLVVLIMPLKNQVNKTLLD